MGKKIAYILQFVSHNRLNLNDADLNVLTEGQSVYNVENSDRRYKGSSSGEAPLQYLLDRAWRQFGDTPVENREIVILPIVSHALYTGVNPQNGMNLFQIYRENITSYLRKQKLPCSQVRTSPVFYDFNPDNNQNFVSFYDSSDSINKGIFDHIVNADPDAEKFVLVDYTGGLRDTSYLITLIAQYLEFLGIRMIKVIYSNNNDKTIHSITYLSRISSMISCINSLSLSGNPAQLLEFFTTKNILNSGADAQEKSEYNKLVQTLKDINGFYGCICINDMTHIDEHKKKLERSILWIRELRSSANIYFSMFSRLFENIRNQFFLDGKDYISYADLVKWCVHHDQINQAVTLFVEKIPQTYLSSPLVSSLLDYDENSMSKKFGDPEALKFYYGLYDNIQTLHINSCPIKSQSPKQLFNLFRSEYKNFLAELKTGQVYSDDEYLSSGRKILKSFSEYMSEKYQDVELFSRCIISMTKFINRNFDENEKRRISNNGSRVPQKNIVSFLNYINLDKNMIAEFMFGKDYHFDVEEQKNTYQKKLEAIEILLNSSYVIPDEILRKQLADVMRYYLIIKIIRNRINHAADFENPTAESGQTKTIEDSVIRRCISGFDILPAIECTELDMTGIKFILQKAIELPVPL